jgi:hypothetical protein
MIRPSHSPWFHHANNSWGMVQITELNMHFSPASCHFMHLSSKHSPVHMTLKGFIWYEIIWVDLPEKTKTKENSVKDNILPLFQRSPTFCAMVN